MMIRLPAILMLVGTLALSQPSTVATGDFDGCPTHGKGGDPALNMQKNRSFVVDAQTGASDVTVQRLEQFPTVPEADGKMRAGWTAALRDAVASREATAAVFTGYIIEAKAEGPEACNCELTAARDHDVHVYVADNASDHAHRNSAIVEVTPRWRAVHPSWNAQNLQSLADGTRVRVTGWLLYDQEHWNMIRSGERGTLWEIHPVTRIQLWITGSWVDLDKAAL